jgi:hypothetical protein
MPKQAISVTLDTENLTWLRGRVAGSGARSVSDLLDQIVTQARVSGRVGPARSVVGTVDIDPSDPSLDHADAAIRTWVEESLVRPRAVRERRGSYRARPASPTRRG